MRNLILRSAGLCCISFLSLTLVACSGADQPNADEAEPALTAEAQAELRGQVPPSDADGASEARRSQRGRGDGERRRRPGRGGQGHGGNGGEACGGSGGDGGVVCALFVEVSDGVCSRPADDPCISQDPDCVAGGQSCEAAGQIFPDGSAVPSGDSCNSCGCNDGSVVCTLALCEEVACALFIEESDGVCSRFPLDPCKSQDPDCVEGGQSCEAGGQIFADGSEVPSGDSCNTCSCGNGNVNCTRIGCEEVACLLFIEESDGVCSRFPLDPCKSQDPDCVTGG